MSNLMEFEIFIEETKRRVSARIGYERNLVVYPVVKNNGVVYQGLIILDPEVNISPSIYLNPYYNRYRNGVLMEDIVDDIIKIYKNNKPVKNFDISQLRNFENAKKKIVMRLVNTEKNIELLRDIPNRPFHDLSIIYNVVVSDFVDEYATILVHNQHLNLWGITEEELYGFAMENSQNILPYRFEDLRTILENAERNVWWEFAGLNMYVLTNRIKINGAVCMVYP